MHINSNTNQNLTLNSNLRYFKLRLRFIIFMLILIALVSCKSIPNNKEQARSQDYIKQMFTMSPEQKANYTCDIPYYTNNNADCGFVLVPRDYTNPKSDKQAIFWFLFKANNQSSKKGTIAVLMGGPGTASSLNIPAFLTTPEFKKLRENYDFLSYDYRGVGLSDPFDVDVAKNCEIYPSDNPALKDPKSFFANCKETLVNNAIDMSGISSINIAKDLDSILTKLTINKVVLYGTSYGTRVATTIARDVPNHVAGIILDGTFPIEINGLVHTADAVKINLNYFIETYRKEKSSLPVQFGNLEERINKLSAKMLKENKTAQAADYLSKIASYAHDQYRFVFADQYLSAIEKNNKNKFNILNEMDGYIPDDRSFSSYNIDNLSFLLLTQRVSSLFMSASIVVPEEYLFIDSLNDFGYKTPALNDTLITIIKQFQGGAPYPIDFYTDFQNTFQLPKADLKENQAVLSEIPTLLFAGSRDLQTPSFWAEMVSKNLKNSRVYEFYQGNHVLALFNSCAVSMIDEFAEKLQAQNIRSASCLDNLNSNQNKSNNNIEEFNKMIKTVEKLMKK